MKKRMILMLAAVVLILAVVGFVKYRQIQDAIAQGQSYQPPPEAVTTVVAQQARWPELLSSIGTAVAVQGVTVSADMPGVVESISFDSGQPVREGQVLVTLDTRQEKAQLVAAEAQLTLATLNHQRADEMFQQGVTPKSEHDRSDAELKQAEARVGEIRALIERKTIRAPFSGMLGIRQVNLGQYLSSGDPIVSLQSLDPIYINFSVPQQQVANLRVGMDAEIALEGVSDTKFHGRVTAVNSIVDEATRNVQVQATLANPEHRIRPGMFVEVQTILGEGSNAVVIPASAVSFAPYGDSIFIVEDVAGPNGETYKGVRQQFVKLGPTLGDQVAIESGLNPGEEVVTSGVFKLRNGAAVVVNNEIQPSNSPTPTPEDS